MNRNKKIAEDMLGPADSAGFNQSSHQVPATASPGDNMDVFALSGPVKKTKSNTSSKRSKKKEESTFPSNKVLSFQDFIKGVSIK